MNREELVELAKAVRYYILAATTRAGSGHPTSSLSATELMTGLLFGGTFRYDADNPRHPNNDRLVEACARHRGISYLRTTRLKTPVIYGPEESFPIGGSKVLRQSGEDRLTVVSAGVTLHEALAAYEELAGEGVMVRVIDLYSIKPVDEAALTRAARETEAVITAEDHYPEGGLGEAVRSALAFSGVPVHCLAVHRRPRSGKPAELLDYEEISRKAMARKVRELSGIRRVKQQARRR